jgi:hypothetical protein
MLNTETLRREIDDLVTRQIVEEAWPAPEALAALAQSFRSLKSPPRWPVRFQARPETQPRTGNGLPKR